MNLTPIDKQPYLLIRRRRTETLVRWWHEMNSRKWPKEIPDEPINRDDPWRGEVMQRIAAEIGRRYIIKGRLPNHA